MKLLIKLLILSFIVLGQAKVQALTLSKLSKDRNDYYEKKITLSGIISNLKHKETNSDDYYDFQLRSKFSSDNVKIRYYLKRYNKSIHLAFICQEGSVAVVQGKIVINFKGSRIGSIVIDSHSPIMCRKDDEYKKITKSYTLSTLNSSKKHENRHLVRIGGYIQNLKISNTRKVSQAKFNLYDPGTKIKLKVKMLLRRYESIVNTLNCGEGAFVTISGPLVSNIKSRKSIGVMNIISKEYIRCSNQKMQLDAREQRKADKQHIVEKRQELRILFRKYKKSTNVKKRKDVTQDEIQAMIKGMAQLCKKYPELNLDCLKATVYVRTMDQRNQLSFKINSAHTFMKDWDQLNKYVLKPNHTVLDIIVSLYPSNSDYIIGIPARCYPDQQFNPAASNFPYSKLSLSKYAKENFTLILGRFNDPKLKCGSLLDSIYFIGNMDQDNELDILKIDMDSPNLLKIKYTDVK